MIAAALLGFLLSTAPPSGDVAARDLFRAAHREFDPRSGALGERCLVDVSRLHAEPGDLILFVTKPRKESLSCEDLPFADGRWEIELVSRGPGKVRVLDHAVLGTDSRWGGCTSSLKPYPDAGPGVVEVYWGTNNEGEGSVYHTDLWALRGGKLRRLVSFEESYSEGYDVMTRIRARSQSEKGTEIDIERRFNSVDEDPALEWSATLAGRYRLTDEAVVAERAVPLLADASSILDLRHGSFLAFDGDERTAWCEGSPGDGVGEWIKVRFDGPMALSEVSIISGFAKTPALFRANARPRQIEITAEPRPPVVLELRDSMKVQRVALPPGAAVSTVVLKVLSVYPGTRYQDLCISDLAFGGTLAW